MRIEKDITIQDKNFRIKQLDGRTGLKTFLKLTKLTSSSLKGFDGSLNVASLAAVLSNNFDEDSIADIIFTLVNKNTIMAPKDFDFDLDIAGNYDILFELIYEMLDLNYKKSLQQLKKKVEDLLGRQLG